MRHRLFLVGVFLLSAGPASTQTYLKRTSLLPVVEHGDTLVHPFWGGVYVPKLQWTDIDADGDTDLFIIQIDGRVSFLRNDGSPQDPSFTPVTDDFHAIPAGEWALFADTDGDGDPDLLVNRTGAAVAYYENTGDPQDPSYVLRQDPVLDSSGFTVLSESQTVPCLADIDGDGDLDFFTGKSTGTLALFENIGDTASFLFRFLTDAFEDILIVTPGVQKTNLHGASSVAFHDQDADGDLDLFWGDFFSSGLYYLENHGTPADPDIPDTTTSTFPSRELLTLGFNAPSFADLDGDGDKELFIGVLYREQDIDNFWYYRNAGTASAPQYELITRNFLSGLDVGRQANPAPVDIDGDGDRDLFVGGYHGRVRFYRNEGTPQQAVFVLDTTVTISPPASEFIAAPAFGDLDDDGDADAIVGVYSGRLHLFLNTGTPSVPVFELTATDYEQIDVGNNSTPILADVDGDGDADLLIGEADGTVNLYPNFGTPQIPRFHRDSAAINYVPSFGESDSSPHLVDIDGDGDLDLFVGYLSGYVALFENRGTAAAPSFQRTAARYKDLKTTQNAAPFFADMDGDGDFDLFLGNIRGGIEYYEAGGEAPKLLPRSEQSLRVGESYQFVIPTQGSPTPKYFLLSAPCGISLDSLSGVVRWTPGADQRGRQSMTVRAANDLGSDTATYAFYVYDDFELHRNYPNPFNGETTIEYTVVGSGRVELVIYNVLGQRVRSLVHRSLVPGHYRSTWDGRDDRGDSVASGVYFYRLRTASYSRSRRMMLVR